MRVRVCVLACVRVRDFGADFPEAPEEPEAPEVELSVVIRDHYRDLASGCRTFVVYRIRQIKLGKKCAGGSYPKRVHNVAAMLPSPA